MIDGGIPIAVAAKMVGHDDLRTTQRHYNALTVDRRRGDTGMKPRCVIIAGNSLYYPSIEKS